jgi:RecQ family ATP-dependent DNA helicase
MSLNIFGAAPTGVAKLSPLEVEAQYGAKIDETLRNVFHHTSFRSNQREIVTSFLGGKDCFVLIPTGGGKSLGFQLPALVFEGITVVVSPLKALMQNQVEALRAQRINASYINSSMPAAERKKVHGDLESLRPSVKLLYVTPELLNTEWINRLKSVYGRGLLSAVVIDEAHTVSIWGHDFRPAYVELGRLKTLFPNVPMMACTATATDKVQQDIIQVLGMKSPEYFTSSFNRPNISYEVRYKELIDNVCGDIVKTVKLFLEKNQPSGIIYCHKREDCDGIAGALRNAGIKGSAYHAGLNDKLRSQTLTDWVAGKVDVVVATIAFGMGIDNPHVRYVIHFTIPQTLEDFYQESGRAGRDGNPSVSILYTSREDISLRAHFLSKSFQDGSDGSSTSSNKGISSNSKDSSYSKDMLLKRKQNALEKMADYSTKPGCRRRALLAYFGEIVTTNQVQALCKATCDYCQNPGLVTKTIQEANDRGALNSGFSRQQWDPDAAQPDLSEPPQYDPMQDEDGPPRKRPPPSHSAAPIVLARVPDEDLDEWRAQLIAAEQAEEQARERRRALNLSSTGKRRIGAAALFKQDSDDDEEEERITGRKKKPFIQPSYLQSFKKGSGTGISPSTSPLNRPFVPPRSTESKAPTPSTSSTSTSSKPLVKQAASSFPSNPAGPSSSSMFTPSSRLSSTFSIPVRSENSPSLLTGTILDPNYNPSKKRAPTDDLQPDTAPKQPKLSTIASPTNLNA